MCGIAGICNISAPAGVSLEALKRMTAVLEHRGPDEAGIYIDDRVGLGHRRLSIIDLSSGTQPISNEDQTMWIIYNGEIFNYPELKVELQKKGHRFRTTSDTEVLLHLYEDKGSACLEVMNGQFAFAIWDSKKAELFLARDKVGILPLYYTIAGDELKFASEIKSIFTNDEVRREIDPVAIDQIFTFWTTLGSRTAFKDIYELPPGHYMKVAKGAVIIRQYWDVPFCPPDEHTNLSPVQIAEKIRELLLDAVRIRLRADVPVGAYLSGGLDSSGVTTLVKKNFNSNVKTFGIRFEHEAFDEGRHQNQMVSFLNVNHDELEAANDKIGSALSRCLWHCEKPLLRTAPVPLFLLSQLVRDNNLKVVLTGEGADEVFGGYNIFREAKVRRFWARQPQSSRRAGLIGRLYPYIFNNPKLARTLQSFFARDLDKTDEPFYSHFIRWDNTSKIKTFFSQQLKESVGSYDGYQELRQRLPQSYSAWDGLSKSQYLEMKIFLSNYLLSSQGDRVAMAHSVEIRPPYLDSRLIEFMATVPSRWKILGLDEKHILKKVFHDVLPEDMTTRPKHPYRAPIKDSLLNGSTARHTHRMLCETAINKAGLFDAKKVNLLLRKLRSAGPGSEIDNMALAGILSCQIIYDQFVANFKPKENGRLAPEFIVDKRSFNLAGGRN
jgi:asparagine synthase (glutamine-hydrolysing)